MRKTSGPVLGLAVTARREQPARVTHEFLYGAPAGVGEVAIGIAHHPLRTVIVVFDGDVHRHVGCLPHDLSVGQRPRGHNGRLVTLPSQASATASRPPSNRMSGTSARLTPSASKASTINMPNAFCPAATGTAANDW